MSIEPKHHWLMIVAQMKQNILYAAALREAKRLRNLRGPYK